MRVVISGALLALLWLGLPVRLPTAADGATNDACLTRAARAPEGQSALAELERCATVVPDDSALLEDLAGLYAAGGQAEKAVTLYRRVIAIDPDHAVARLRLAELLMSRGEAKEARELAEAALRLQPNRHSIIALIEQAQRMERR